MNEISRIFQLVRNRWRSVPEDVPEAYRAYYKSRDIAERKYLCHAPFNNMYFNTRGEVANCWLTFDDPEIYREGVSIKDIWTGEKFSRLRENIRQFNLQEKCGTCEKNFRNGNYVNVLAKAYDNHFALTDYPSVMEFELSNTCNLECTMCNGELSSVIRKNREQLPALKSPYGDRFVEELREFIPHLQEARFNGGEPFLIHIYYKIWDLMLALNPGLKIVVATNGTILNERVKSYLERGNFHLNISIDSLQPERYATIRVNGDLTKLLEHFAYFKAYCHTRKRDLCVMVNPMRNNWQEMPDFVRFCNEHNVQLWFNTIVYPASLAMWNMPAAELETAYTTLSSRRMPLPVKHLATALHNEKIFRNFVEQQVRTWLQEARMQKA